VASFFASVGEEDGEDANHKFLNDDDAVIFSIESAFKKLQKCVQFVEFNELFEGASRCAEIVQNEKQTIGQIHDWGCSYDIRNEKLCRCSEQRRVGEGHAKGGIQTKWDDGEGEKIMKRNQTSRNFGRNGFRGCIFANPGKNFGQERDETDD
jgi:hypothetical protein